LLLLGVECSFMDSFLASARDADHRVLGYVSSAHFDVPDDAHLSPRIVLRPCIVVASVDDAERALRVPPIALRRSPVGRLIGGRLSLSLDVQLEIAS
jgi:hypothetical protein